MTDDEDVINKYRSDLISFIFQQHYYKFNPNAKTYNGAEITYDVQEVKSLNSGAFVKDGVLYVDKVKIEEIFTSKKYQSEQAWGYAIAPLDPAVLSLYDNDVAKALYYKYTYQREINRSIATNSFENISKTKEFFEYKNELKDDANPDFRAYEMVLRDRTLDGLNYHGHMFFGKRAYAKQVMALKDTNPELFEKYQFLSDLEIVNTRYGTTEISNLRIGGRPRGKDIERLYDNLQELADPTVRKVKDSFENALLSNLFQKMTHFALLQSGIDTGSTFSLIPFVSNESYLNLVKEPYEQFLTDSDTKPLDLYDNLFEAQYSEEGNKALKVKVKAFAKSIYGITPYQRYTREYMYLPGDENPETLTQATVSIGLQGYRGGFEDKGKGTPEGDGKDKAMREIADGFIGEIQKTKSSTNTSLDHINNKQQQIAKDNGISNPAKTFIESRGVTHGVKSAFTKTIMLARNSEFKNKPLSDDTKVAIKVASNQGIEFVVGDMPGVDSQFIDYLQEIGAKFTIFHTGATSRIKVESNTYGQTTQGTVISEPYGVVVAETNPSETKTKEFVDLIKPQIQAQAYKENASGTANDMFMYGLRWTRKSSAKKPLNNKSYANKGLPITDAKATDGYVYDTVDQNGNPLAPISDLQPIINELQNSLGIDMSDYDAVIGNIYLPGQNIATHRDTTESLSARNYPVVVYTIGNNSGIGIYEDKKNPGSPTFASDSKTTIPTKNGTIYTFGMDGKGRFELAHDTPKGIKRDKKFPPITLPNGTVVENYTITLTFRRAADLQEGMPTAPSKVSSSRNVVMPSSPANTTINFDKVKIGKDSLTNTLMFFPSGVTMLTEATMKEFAEVIRSTGKKQLVVFNEIDGRTKNVQGNNSAYRAMGDMAYGIVTKKGSMPTKPDGKLDKPAMFTDETLDDNKVMIDEMIKGLAAKQAEGYELVFDFRGYGQYMAGYNEYAENKEGKPDFDASAPETFNYLSQQLFENFGYLNPNYLKTLEGRRIVQSRQPVTDEEIFDLKKSCKLA